MHRPTRGGCSVWSSDAGENKYVSIGVRAAAADRNPDDDYSTQRSR